MLRDVALPPRAGGAPASVVALLHGLGDSGEGLIGLGEAWRDLLPTTLFVAPDAPFPCDMAPFGFQWFSLRDPSPGIVLNGVRHAAPQLNDYLDLLLARHHLPASRLALVGFSQGAMMSLYVAPRRPEAVAGVIGYSGALIGGATLPRERVSSPPVLLVHGQEDTVVPFAALAEAERGLHDANMNVTALVRPGLGHSIDDEGLRAGGRFLQKVLG